MRWQTLTPPIGRIQNHRLERDKGKIGKFGTYFGRGLNKTALPTERYLDMPDGINYSETLKVESI